MSSNVLFVFKDRKSVTLNNDFWSDKFKIRFNVFQFFINDNLNFSNSKIISSINEIIKLNKIDFVLFEGDHAHIINYNFIKDINKNTRKGIFLGDDMVWHNLNLITAQSCDFVFSSCPISAYKFQEIGINSMFVPIECNDKLLKDYGEKKIYDVLHFGREKTKRSEYINFLKENNINVKSVSPYDEESDTFEKLAKLINQSKIVINFSESTNGNRGFNPLRIFKSFYQLKGRVQMAGLCKSFCITEYSPSIYLMYKKEEVPSFQNKEECLEIINCYLKDSSKLIDATNKFYQKSLEYGDSKYIEKINNFINKRKQESRNNKNFKSPLWYNYIFLNQNLRLRFKRGLLIGFLREFFFNFSYYKDFTFFNYLLQSLLNVFLFLRYLPLTIIKTFISFKK